MYFEVGHLYHIYNQGSNRQKIFFSRKNYIFFLKKMRQYLLPYCDIVAYCLKPNHFHWMIRVNKLKVQTRSTTLSLAPSNDAVSLQKSIGILLASYTRAVNKEQNISGSLFRSKTKAKCLTLNDAFTPSYFITQSGTLINTDALTPNAPLACFEYIHHNPVSAHLVKDETEWEFSSAIDYAGLRDGTSVSKEIINAFC